MRMISRTLFLVFGLLCELYQPIYFPQAVSEVLASLNSLKIICDLLSARNSYRCNFSDGKSNCTRDKLLQGHRFISFFLYSPINIYRCNIIIF
nr:unnamed protein product [Callosobruchus chinensis]